MQISLSLVSHTNAGKTTLARTLLSRDIGTVRDESHVTDTAEAFEMIRSDAGDTLMLWDTPGFGDSVRLARRLEKSDSPLNWMVGQVWDRLRDRPLFSSQQALRNVREQADIVLYLVNASEDPEAAGYVEPEMRILAWTAKPVIVLLNQMGQPRPHAMEQAEVQLWRDHLAGYPHVRQVLALDAFARCWVQERVLLDAIGPLLDGDRRAAFARLYDAWVTQREQAFSRSVQILADGMARAAVDFESITDTGIAGRLREIGSNLGLPGGQAQPGRDQAMIDLARRWDQRQRSDTDALIALHGLAGSATGEVMTRVDAHFSISSKVSEGKAAVLGGVASGALAGLKADLATGGFTMGGGMLAGGILGALGAAGLARGYNMVRGTDRVLIQWSDPVLLSKLASGMLTYLAVIHFGRGRGNWAASEYPAHWPVPVNALLDRERAAIQAAWKSRGSGPRDQNASDAIAARLAPLIDSMLRQVLRELYPPPDPAPSN